MATFVFMAYPLSVLQSLCLIDPVLRVLSNDVFDILANVCSSVYVVYQLAMEWFKKYVGELPQ